jgi:pSer/pThr/pTyr-binding forkhead associated (FHA) protein
MTVIEPRARKGTVFAVAEELTIGRAAGCTVSITDDTFISQLHARVFVQNGEVFVEDLGSTNGSYLNGQKLARPMPLSKGDRLQIGATVLEAE